MYPPYINSGLPNSLFVRRLGYGRCPFRLTVVELGTKLFIKGRRAHCYNVLPCYGMLTLILTENQREFIRQFVLVFILDSKTTDMEFLDELTEGLDRVLMVRGGGREVITIYS